MRRMEKLACFWFALVAAARDNPLHKANNPIYIAARHRIGRKAAHDLLDRLYDAGYLLPVHNGDKRNKPLIAVQLLKTRLALEDFSELKTTKPKTAARKRKVAAVALPTHTPIIIRKPRVAVFIDCDNLCIKLQQRNSVLEITAVLQKAAEEGDFVVCFGFVQRKTLERHREAINGFPQKIKVVMSPDYSQASDEQILDMITLFAGNNYADIFFIGTADLQLFEAAQKIVNDAKKRVALLDCCDISVGIHSEANRVVRVQNAAVPLSKQRLQQCAERIVKTKRLGRGPEAEFLRDVVHQLRIILSGGANEHGKGFRELQKSVWHWLHRDHKTIGWHPQDCQYALEVLHTLNILVAHRGTDERTYYRLNREAETHGVF